MMTTESKPNPFHRYGATQLAEMRRMVQDALDEGHLVEENTARLAKIDEAFARYSADGAEPGREARFAPGAENNEVGREAGSAARNQFGTFAVHGASEKQIAFLRKLIDTNGTSRVTLPANLDKLSKTSASALIDKLMNAGPKPGADTRPPCKATASEKQVGFLRKLLAEKQHDFDADQIEAQLAAGEVSVRVASAMIDQLMKADRKPRQALIAIHAGAYRVDGRVIRVYLGQRSGQMLAQELVDATATTRDEAWKYLGLAARFVPADAHRMTVEECEQASAGTADHGWCCVCGRDLDDPVSVARGIGPVCRAKQGGGE